LAAQALLRQDDLPGRNERLCDLANALGEYYHQINDAERSIAHYWQAWLIANELLDRERMSKTAHNLGLVYMDHLHEYERSLEYLSKSRDLAEQTGNRQMEGLSAVSLGACYYWLGDFVRAIEHYQAAAAIFRETGNRTYLGHTYYGLAEAYAQVEAPDEMYRYYAAALTIAREQNNQNALRNLAELAHLHPQLAATHADGGWQLNQRQKLALEHIRQHGSIHNRVYQQLTGVAQKQAVRDLNELVEHGWLRRIGQGRATRYEMK
jgi:tetratricopeptide (TPR) repeat protein